jgi:hypothetical protein
MIRTQERTEAMDIDELQMLTLETIGELDAGASAAFQTCLKRVLADCSDRPGDPTARTVVMKLSMVPMTEQNGECSEVSVEIECVGKNPPYRTKPLSLGLRRNGMAVFRAGSPGNVNQRVLPMNGDDES